MSKYIETVWKLRVNGREFEAERTEHANMTVYTISSGSEGRATVFTDRELPALQAFLTALATDPGTRVVRCKYCDEPLQFSTCSVNGVEVPDDYDGPWVGDSGSSRCEESPKANDAWPKAHYPRKSDICIIKGCKRFRTAGVTCEQHEKIDADPSGTKIIKCLRCGCPTVRIGSQLWGIDSGGTKCDEHHCTHGWIQERKTEA